MAYARPVLCRLCGFPASDGGVPVSEVDKEKLSEWCLRMMDTELDEEGLKYAVFCHFCVWQARFLYENCASAEKSCLPVWWKQRDNFKGAEFEYNYVLYNVIQPCAVTIPVMSKNLLQKHGLFEDTGTERKGRRPVVSNCVYCSAQLESKKALVRHVQVEHRNDLTFKCYTCKLFFLSSQDRNNHMEENHLILKLGCAHCSKRFGQIRALAYHLKVEHNKQLNPLNYSSNAYFRRDRRDEQVHNHVVKVCCIYCKKYFKKELLLKHMKTCHNSVYIRCSFYNNCGTFFHTEEERDKHVWNEHESGLERVQCIYCERMVFKKAISTHILMKHNQERIKCHYSKCATYFHTLEEKQKHILEVHESGEGKYRCIYCKRFIQDSHPFIIRHMQNHHKTEAIKCDYQFHCHNYFLTQEEKQRHILEVHESGEDKIRCEFCPRMVRIKGMSDHIRIHHRSESKGLDVELEWVECIYCQSQMKKINLAVHMARKHKTEAIRCNLLRCSTWFKTVEDKQKHVNLVHQAKSKKGVFKCCFCNLVHNYRCSLVAHIKSRHPAAIKCRSRGCQEYFLSKKKQEEHFEKMHPLEEKGKTFRCTYCLFTATSREEKNAHSAQVHAKATVRCPDCPKMFKAKSALKIHFKRVHNTRRELFTV